MVSMNYNVTLPFTRKTLQLQFLSDWKHENEAFQDQNFLLKFYPHNPLCHMSLPKSQKGLICGANLIEGPEAPVDLH